MLLKSLDLLLIHINVAILWRVLRCERSRSDFGRRDFDFESRKKRITRSHFRAGHCCLLPHGRQPAAHLERLLGRRVSRSTGKQGIQMTRCYFVPFLRSEFELLAIGPALGPRQMPAVDFRFSLLLYHNRRVLPRSMIVEPPVSAHIKSASAIFQYFP